MSEVVENFSGVVPFFFADLQILSVTVAIWLDGVQIFIDAVEIMYARVHNLLDAVVIFYGVEQKRLAIEEKRDDAGEKSSETVAFLSKCQPNFTCV